SLFSRGREDDAVSAGPHDSRNCVPRRSVENSANQLDSRALPVAGDCEINIQIAEQGFGSDAERRATRDDFRSRSSGAKRSENLPGFRRVVPQRDGVAVVNVAYRDPDYVGVEPARGLGRGSGWITPEAEVEESHAVAGLFQGGRDACEPVR